MHLRAALLLPALGFVFLASTPTAAQDVEESRTSAGLVWLQRHQNPDGSWGPHPCGAPHGGEPPGDVEHTALGLLAFLNAGYLHISKAVLHDAVTGKDASCGQIVKRALRYLILNQAQAGLFHDPGGSPRPESHAVATVAMVEAYGRSQSQLFKQPAELALARLVEEDLAVSSPATLAWTVLALQAAKLARLPLPSEALDRLRPRVRDLPGDGALASAVRLAGGLALDLERNWLAADAHGLAASGPDPDPFVTFLAAHALSAFDGPDAEAPGDRWTSWCAGGLDPLLNVQARREAGCAWGSWPGTDRVRSTSLLTLAGEAREGLVNPNERTWPR